MSDHPSDRHSPEKPRSEPEIIPPGRGDASPWSQDTPWPDELRAREAEPGAQASSVFVTVDEQGRAHYRTFTPPGPFTIGVVLALIGLIGGAILLLALGFVLFLIPVVAVVIAALALSGRVRTWWRRLARN